MLIQTQLFTLMLIRIQLPDWLALVDTSRWVPNLHSGSGSASRKSRIRLFTLMRIRTQLSTLMLIRIQLPDWLALVDHLKVGTISSSRIRFT